MFILWDCSWLFITTTENNNEVNQNIWMTWLHSLLKNPEPIKNVLYYIAYCLQNKPMDGNFSGSQSLFFMIWSKEPDSVQIQEFGHFEIPGKNQINQSVTKWPHTK